MRILATSDLHGHIGQMAWISAACAHADLLLLAGDLLHEGIGQDRVERWLGQLPCPLVVASGNHDIMLAGPYWLHALRAPTRIIDDRGEVGGVPICALPWEFENGDWLEQATAEAIAAIQRGRPWILVTHSIPLSLANVEGFESEVTARLALTGHTHQIAYRGPWINCGHSNSSIPNHAKIDWTTGKCFFNLSGFIRPVGHRLTH